MVIAAPTGGTQGGTDGATGGSTGGPTGTTMTGGRTARFPATGSSTTCAAVPTNGLSFADQKATITPGAFNRARTDEQIVLSTVINGSSTIIGSVVNAGETVEFPFASSPQGLTFRVSFVFGNNLACFDLEIQK